MNDKMTDNIPCHIQITHHCFGETTSFNYYRTDPTCNDGWVNCDPLGTYFSKEGRNHIKDVLTRQGWFRKLFLDDHGEIITEVVVKSCPVDQWYTKEEK
jgi:hypothetical protein